MVPHCDLHEFSWLCESVRLGLATPNRTASEVLDVEQLVFDTAMSLMAVDGWAQQLAARLRVASRDLLRHARDLPESKVSTAALRRKLRRHQVFHQTAVVGAEMQETGPVAQAADGGWHLFVWVDVMFLSNPFCLLEIQLVDGRYFRDESSKHVSITAPWNCARISAWVI